MYPINNIAGIEKQEKNIEGSHVIALLLVKPQDKNAEFYLKMINYYHQKSSEYCSIYMLGYSFDFQGMYSDAVKIEVHNTQEWEYSDSCFIEACDELKRRLKNWNYSGELEMIILQNSSAVNPKKYLDFTNYVYVDINYGISHKYIDSIPRFMERFLEACKSEVSAVEVVSKAERKRIKPRKIIETTLELMPKLPKPVTFIMRDHIFFKTYKGR